MKHPYQAQAQTTNRDAAVQRLLDVYTIAIEANASGDQETLAHSLALLQKTLNPEANPTLARELAALYTRVEQAAQNQQPAVVAEILERLRGYWVARDRIEKKHFFSTNP
jgi:flagellin-specific chaperone FliS